MLKPRLGGIPNGRASRLNNNRIRSRKENLHIMIKTLKTKQFKITAFVLAVVLTLSCVFWNSTKVPALEIDGANVQTFAGSRAIENGKLFGAVDAPAEIGIFITDGSADKYNATNVNWTHDGTSWTADSSILFEGADSNQKISAYYPYAENVTAGSVTVTASEQTDWLVAPATDLTSSNVNLNMTHALTKLVINPSTFGSEVDNTSIAKIEVGGMYASGDLNIADNSWSNLSSPNATLEMKNNELLVIPMASCTSFDVVITMEDNRVFTTTVTCPDGKLEAGTQYNIKLKIGQDVVVLGGITATPWGAPVDGGTLEKN